MDFQSGFTIQDISLFNYTNGGSVPGAGNPAGPPVVQRTATENDTNIAAQGSMASTEEMLVYSIRPEVHFYLTTTQNDFTTRTYTGAYGFTSGILTAPALPGGADPWYAVLNQQLLLRLIISQKTFSEAGFGYYNKGFGPTAGATSSTNNGIASQEAVRSFVIPHHIGSQEKFRVDLVNNAEINAGAVDFGINVEETAPAPIEGNPIPQLAATIRIYLDGLYKRPTA